MPGPLRPLLLAPLLAATLGCGAREVEIVPPPDPAEELLLWAVGADGAATTLWIRGNSRGGTVLGRRPGILLALPDGVVEVREREVSLPTCDCAAEPGDGGTAECPAVIEGGATGAVLVAARLPDGDEIGITEAPEASDHGVPLYEALEFGAEITASVGPFLFVRADERSLACGAAHDDWSARFEVFDAAAGEPTGLLSEEERARLLDREQAAAFRLMAGDTLADAARPEDLELTMITPVAGPGGALGLRYQFSARSSFAASDGTWGAYTRSVDVPAASLPAALLPFAPVPRALAGFPPPEPGLRFGGYTRLAPAGEQLAALARLFSSAHPEAR